MICSKCGGNHTDLEVAIDMMADAIDPNVRTTHFTMVRRLSELVKLILIAARERNRPDMCELCGKDLLS